jgi:hypothetical protein
MRGMGIEVVYGARLPTDASSILINRGWAYDFQFPQINFEVSCDIASWRRIVIHGIWHGTPAKPVRTAWHSDGIRGTP